METCSRGGLYSFEMWWMTTRTKQLLYIAEATGSKIYTRNQKWRHVAQQRPRSCPWNSSMPTSTAFTRRRQPGQWWVSKAYTLAMPSSIQMNWQVWALSHSAYGVLNFEGHQDNHYREMHYRLAIACDVCQVFASMFMQVVLEHQSWCRMKSHKKSKMKRKDVAPLKPMSMSPAGQQNVWDFPSNPSKEHGSF